MKNLNSDTIVVKFFHFRKENLAFFENCNSLTDDF